MASILFRAALTSALRVSTISILDVNFTFLSLAILAFVSDGWDPGVVGVEKVFSPAILGLVWEILPTMDVLPKAAYCPC